MANVSSAAPSSQGRSEDGSSDPSCVDEAIAGAMERRRGKRPIEQVVVDRAVRGRHGRGCGRMDGMDAAAVLKLIQRVHRRCVSSGPIERLAVSEHRRATEGLALLHEYVLSGCVLCEKSQLSLTCCGVALMRRIFSEIEGKEATAQLKTTLTLVFATLVMSKVDADGEEEDVEELEEVDGVNMCDQIQEGEDEEELAEAMLRSWRTQSVSEVMYQTSDVLLSDGLEAGAASPASHAQACTSGDICQSLLTIAKHRCHTMEVDELTRHAIDFFRLSAAAVSTSLFDACSNTQADDFLTLDSASFLVSANCGREARLQGLAEGAESEAGQALLRDIILSFTLPRHVVGVRRTCLLTRESNAIATKEYPEILNAAHEAALRGAAYIWENDSELYRISALLAGMAMLLLRGGQNEMRRADAFSGQVDLPFLETKTPAHGSPRLALLETTNEWVVYTVQPNQAQPTVALRSRGFEGLCAAAILFIDKMKTFP